MTIYAFHTPRIASPMNERRAGTIRSAGDDPEPIIVYKGWSNVINFGFRDNRNRAYDLGGNPARAIIYNRWNEEIFTGPIFADPLSKGIGQLFMSTADLATIDQDLYSLVIEYTDYYGRVMVANTTTRSLRRFPVKVIDQVTEDADHAAPEEGADGGGFGGTDVEDTFPDEDIGLDGGSFG